MSNQITVTLTSNDVVWRYQGDVSGGDILTAKLQLFMQREYRDAEGNLYKVEQLPTIEGTPEELGFLTEFTSIKEKLVALISGI